MANTKVYTIFLSVAAFILWMTTLNFIQTYNNLTNPSAIIKTQQIPNTNTWEVIQVSKKLVDNTPLKIITNEDDYHLSGILHEFEQTTGIKTELSYTEDSMLSRLDKREEWQMVFNKISSELVEAKEKGFLWTLSNTWVSAEFKDRDNQWLNLSYRLRSFYLKKWITEFPKNYEDLSNPKYKGKICIRPLTHTYNVQLVAYMIAKHGEEYTKEWLKGLYSNLAVIPSDNDRGQVKKIKDGICEIAIANSYYMGLMLSDAEQREWAQLVDLYFPNQDKDGSFPLYNWVAVTKSSQWNENVTKLIDFMLSPLGQEYIASSNFEYPLNAWDVTSEMIKSFGSYQKLSPDKIKVDNSISQEVVAKSRETALLLIKELTNK